jgi:hypothetical protein
MTRVRAWFSPAAAPPHLAADHNQPVNLLWRRRMPPPPCPTSSCRRRILGTTGKRWRRRSAVDRSPSEPIWAQIGDASPPPRCSTPASRSLRSCRHPRHCHREDSGGRAPPELVLGRGESSTAAAPPGLCPATPLAAAAGADGAREGTRLAGDGRPGVACRRRAGRGIGGDGGGRLGTSRKKGFHSPQLVPKLFDPQLKGALVPVHSKMWAREH